jgi:hypothetical protein
MPLLVDLSHEVQRRLAESERPLPVEVGMFRDDVERLLAYLAEPLPWLDYATNLRHRAAFADVSIEIANVLRERQDFAVREAMPGWLETLVGHWKEMRSTVITLNYDVLVEAAALPQFTGGVAWNAMYRAPLVPLAMRTAAVWGGGAEAPLALLKLHGSLTWWWEGTGALPGDTIYDSGLHGGWSMQSLASPYADRLERLTADKVPMVVPPTATKSTFYDDRVLASQWSEAARSLSEAEELVLIGYSLPPSDLVLSSLLLTNLREDATIVPVNTSKQIIRQLENLFGPDPDGRVIANYTGFADPIDAYVKRFCN